MEFGVNKKLLRGSYDELVPVEFGLSDASRMVATAQKSSGATTTTARAPPLTDGRSSRDQRGRRWSVRNGRDLDPHGGHDLDPHDGRDLDPRGH